MSSVAKIEPFRIKKKCVKVFSRMMVIATSSRLYPGTAELSPLEGTIRIDKRGQSKASQANIHKPRTGLPTVSSMKNLRKCMDVFQMSLVKSRSLNPKTQKANYVRAAFITFTIPDAHTMLDSREGYNALLKHMIEYLIYHFEVSRYIWRFERQDRGQAHWHICVNRYCELYAVKTYWLHLLAKEGLTKDYYEKYGFDPTSACIIEGIKTNNELAFYFNKYFNKKTQSDKPTAGRWWGADIVTKRMPLPLIPITERFTSLCDTLSRAGSIDVVDTEIDVVRAGQEKLPEEIRKVDKVKVCTTIRCKKLPPVWLLCPIQRDIYDKYISLNRAGDSNGAIMLRNEVLEYNMEVNKWIGDRCRAMEEMAFLARLKKIEKVSKPVCINRQRRRSILAAQAAKAKEMFAGVSLYT